MISIHALLAEGDLQDTITEIANMKISIHALLAEGDPVHAARVAKLFISIHALLAEGDRNGN